MKKLLKKLASIAAAMVAAFSVAMPAVVASADDAQTTTTSVMQDLQSDTTFNADDYPSKTIEELKTAKEEYLQVIKIGESVNDELYIYVYQPSDSTKEIEAVKVHLGRVSDNNSATVYPLKLVSTEGVFDKYLVEGLTVLKAFSMREYQIVTLFRPFDSALDEKVNNGGKDSYMAVTVAQTWYARNTENGAIEYAHTKDEVITITDKWHGSIDYSDGISADGLDFFDPFTTSHVVAFTTDKKIEKLKSAELYFQEFNYEEHFCSYCVGAVISGDIFEGNAVLHDGYVVKKEGASTPKHVKINENQTGGNAADGWWAHSYSWNRISTIEGFLSKEDSLSSSAIKRLTEIASNSNGKGAFVLRFYETNYKFDKNGGKYHAMTTGHPHIDYADLRMGTRIKDVSILKLTFETDGVPYTMGVVDSMTTPDTVPDGTNGFWEGVERNIKDGLLSIQKTLRLISLALGSVFMVALLGLAVYGITKLIEWITLTRRGGGNGKNTS